MPSISEPYRPAIAYAMPKRLKRNKQLLDCLPIDHPAQPHYSAIDIAQTVASLPNYIPIRIINDPELTGNSTTRRARCWDVQSDVDDISS